jgi:DNA-binding NarL/FixJ family response regulator
MASDVEAARGPSGGISADAPLRVVIADDDVLLRAGLASLLDRQGFEVVGEAGDAHDLLALVEELRPDLVVVDIRMPPSQTVEGLEAARSIREEFPEIGVMLLSAHIDVEHALTLLSTGRGIGYLLKSRVVDVDDFVENLSRVARGASIIDPTLVGELISARRRNDPLDVLSPREREVLALMAEGRSNLGIAQSLWVTEGTVEKHVQHILTKLSLDKGEADHRRVLAVLTFLQSLDG